MDNTVRLSASDHLPLRACPLCECQVSTPVFQTIRKCGSCGLSFVSPLGNFHGENETEEYFLSDYLPLHRANWQNSLAERRAHLELIRRYSSLPSQPRLLDVGCALGFMLQEAKAAGWDAVGVETSGFAARYASEHTGCTVYEGTLQNAGLEPASFDVVTLMDVIEHIPEPCTLLREVSRVLRPGGTIFLVTPNFGSFFVWLYGPKAYGIGPDEHVTYFSRANIKIALRKSGFHRIIAGSKDFYADNLNRLLKGRNNTQPRIKAAFRADTSLSKVRKLVNGVLMHVPLGDKLIALAKK
jgi:2-polyprenyl-3-methyl-5-hydroxy-6-metoxy-1,4-benzoquinol methylase